MKTHSILDALKELNSDRKHYSHNMKYDQIMKDLKFLKTEKSRNIFYKNDPWSMLISINNTQDIINWSHKYKFTPVKILVKDIYTTSFVANYQVSYI